MQDFINKNTNLDVNVLIHKNAFVDIVKSLPKTIEDIKIVNNKIEIETVQNNNNIVYFISVEFKKGINIPTKLSEIQNKIETHTKLLINKKPHNVIINFVGEF